MKNKNKLIYVLFLIFFNNLVFFELLAENQFNFDVTEIIIENEGNTLKGLKRGKATSDNGIIIEADTFEYNKITNILNAYGNVILEDSINKLVISTEIATYFKNEEKLLTRKNSTANDDKGNQITGENFSYDKINNIFNAKGNVEVNNKIENYKINSENITYFKNQEKITSKGKTTSLIQSKYYFSSKDVTFDILEKTLSSNFNTRVKDSEANLFILDKFKYLINSNTLKGENIIIITQNGKPESDKYYFSNAIIDLKNNNFLGKDPKIYVHKNIFDNTQNDPRLYGSSSIKKGKITTITNGIFTSCKIQKGKCPPWKIRAKKIKHDKEKKTINL
tara:strand:+ start:166 stop:1170 length:1005 start_codon:yes stop_codon:yes gene_type:complete